MTEFECRACLNTINTHQRNKESESEKWKIDFEVISGFKVLDDEPQELCLTCKENLEISWNFKNLVIETQKRLKDKLVEVCFEDERDEMKEETIETTEEEEVKYFCEYCEGKVTFRSAGNLMTHLRRFHSTERSEECEMCGKMQFRENFEVSSP